MNVPKRLGRDTLMRLPADVERPAEVPAGIGIVHLGLGAFHRAHQAIYTDDALAASGGPWAIAGVSLKSPGVREKLREQDGFYTAIEKSTGGTRRRIVGSLRAALFLADDRDAIMRHLVAPATSIVMLTITEKGYCHDPATGTLDFAHPDIVHDLGDDGRLRESPISATGLICAALHQRRRTHGTPLTIVSCDNLPSNGKVLRRLVLAHADALDRSLAQWIDAHCAFPSTMVDRIVPSTTEVDIGDNDAALGLHDAAPVVFEPYRQWVIEDAFAGPRPRWEAGGAQFVDDVAPFELLKLRMLNGSHSAMAYLGYLAGHSYIHEVSRDLRFERFIAGLWDESGTTLKPLPGIDLTTYRWGLWSRYGNSALPHRTWQIAMDGSQKLPQRLLNPVRDRLRAGASIDHLALAVAGWMRYIRGVEDAGNGIDVRDPLAARFAAIAAESGDEPLAFGRGLLAIRAIFGDDLIDDPRFVDPVLRWHRSIECDGVQCVLDTHFARDRR